VAIVEALLWLDRPLSAADLTEVIDNERYRVSSLSYHMSKLAEVDAIEMVGRRQGRGATEKFYFFPPAE
jgi:hypothetical protein